KWMPPEGTQKGVKMKGLTTFILLGILVASPVFSEDQTINQLSKKIEQLENRVEILESIIAEQSKNKSEISSSIPTDKKTWRKIKKGMTQDEVRKLLGEPLTVSGGGLTNWYYSESLAHSWVAFTDREGVRAWNEPE